MKINYNLIFYLLWAIGMIVIGFASYPNPLAGIFAAVYIYMADGAYRKRKMADSEPG